MKAKKTTQAQEVAQENNTAVVYRAEPYPSFWRRFPVGFRRLQSVNGQL